MKTIEMLHMNRGEGENSYAMNSSIQNQIIKVASPMIEQAVADCVHNTQPQSMGIADLGCSSGPNSLMVMSMIIDTVRAASAQMGIGLPELRVSLNDLPVNDFNSLFAFLPDFYDDLRKIGVDEECCFICGVAASFYGKLFPKKSLHFVHSSSSLHWLSQVPSGLDKYSNKGKIYISKTSPDYVLKAYLHQFQKDLFDFMRFRADEMVAGGGMLLSFMGRASPDASAEVGCHQWELLAQALMGLVQEEDIDSLNVPYYAPSVEEVQNVIQKEGSFLINHIEAFEIQWDGGNACDKRDSDGLEKLTRGKRVAKIVRAVIESMIESHFGKGIIDELFARYGQLVDDYFSKVEAKHINLVISVTRKA
ncbi:jasmonate o-methyltransferase [Phtheirospermum japonicum]|uniref:Jasmonate o-methyltransferase n=1 Tax=Phtheirospermum japonicum TaxID=374723 RepID=A0A830CE18_9LAMI|nr:jasmonate o-methyltransferase [Phtheirospermum japonicum]